MPVSKPLNGKDDTFDLLIPHETPHGTIHPHGNANATLIFKPDQ